MSAFQTPRAGDRLLPVEEALERVLAEAEPAGSETVPLDAVLGRILREEIRASGDLPPADNSAMDGYAVRSDDVAAASNDAPVRLRVVDDLPAGRVPETPLAAGTAIRIMTGAFVPPGADSVVQVELTDGGSGEVAVFSPVRSGANVRRRGEDMRAGAVVLDPGTRIGPASVAVLAAARRGSVVVSKRPEVAILATGDELLEAADAPREGSIVNTNGPLLSALVAEAGAIPRPLGIVRDDLEETIAAIERAASSDVVITTGGVSVGAFDYVKAALDALGAETRFWRVAMKPGKPVVLSRLRGKLCFGLPGNPASAFVSFHLFVAPALRKMLGLRDLLAPVVSLPIASPLKADRERRVYYRARVVARDGALVAHPLTSQGSGSLTSMAGANALVMIEPGASAEMGSIRRALLLECGGSPPL